MTARQVREFRDVHPSTVVLDVRIPEDFAAGHVSGALNVCVFLISFAEDVRGMVPDPSTPLVVYGADQVSLESTEAAQRLSAAGFSTVFNFAGGLMEWKSDGLPVSGMGAPSLQPIADGMCAIDLSETRIEWTGRNLLNKHTGTVPVKSGILSFSEGWLRGGELVMDMTGLACADLSDTRLNSMLIDHLKSPDFFDVERYPEARLVIRKAGPVPGGRPGSPNLQLLCTLTVRGISRDVATIAVAGRTPEGRLAAQAVLAFDRTEFGSAYGSGRFFRSLGKHLVNDLVEVQARLVA